MDRAEPLAAGALWHRLSEYRDIPAGVALAHVVAAAGGEPAGDLVLVPVHPQTGDVWQPRAAPDPASGGRRAAGRRGAGRPAAAAPVVPVPALQGGGPIHARADAGREGAVAAGGLRPRILTRHGASREPQWWTAAHVTVVLPSAVLTTYLLPVRPPRSNLPDLSMGTEPEVEPE